MTPYMRPAALLPSIGEYLLVGALDSTQRLVGTEKGEVFRVFKGHTNKLYCSSSTFVTTLPQQAVACGSEDGGVFVWDINTMKVCRGALECDMSRQRN